MSTRFLIAIGCCAAALLCAPPTAKAGPYAGPGLGEAAGRAVGGSFARRLASPFALGSAASVDVDGEVRGTAMLSLGALVFRGPGEPELFETPGGGLGFELSYVFDQDAWGTVQLWARVGVGPILLGGSVGVAAGRSDAVLVVGPEVSLPVRVPVAESVDLAFELFAKGEAFTLPSQYPHRLLVGARVHGW